MSERCRCPERWPYEGPCPYCEVPAWRHVFASFSAQMFLLVGLLAFVLALYYRLAR